MAILAFNRALELDDELGIDEAAMAALVALGSPVFEEDELEEFERKLHDDGPGADRALTGCCRHARAEFRVFRGGGGGGTVATLEGHAGSANRPSGHRPI